MEQKEIYKNIIDKVLIKYTIKGYTPAMTLFSNLVNKYNLNLAQVKELKEKVIKAIEKEQKENTENDLKKLSFTCNIF